MLSSHSYAYSLLRPAIGYTHPPGDVVDSDWLPPRRRRRGCAIGSHSRHVLSYVPRLVHFLAGAGARAGGRGDDGGEHDGDEDHRRDDGDDGDIHGGKRDHHQRLAHAGACAYSTSVHQNSQLNQVATAPKLWINKLQQRQNGCVSRA
eukprot:2841935-Pyramimonas_sp.AAC.1